MKTRIGLALFFGLGVFLAVEMSYAQTLAGGGDSLTTEATRMDRMSGTLGDAKVTDKLAAEFSSFLGTDAKAVITGLRNGTPIILTRTTSTSTPGTTPTTTTTATTITPSTGKMGFGNVFISLALAKQELSQLGIAQPTPQQLQAALLGGSITSGTGTTATSTSLPGILQLRSQHMGWGQIAQKLGFKLGSVVSGLKAANHGLAVGAASAGEGTVVSASGHPVGSSESGVVSASGRNAARSERGAFNRGDQNEGIVSGLGRPVGVDGGITTGRGHANGISAGSSGGAAHGRANGR